jgi:hypothetical protein
MQNSDDFMEVGGSSTASDIEFSLMVCYSVVAICQSQMTGRATFYLFRFLLGVLEG